MSAPRTVLVTGAAGFIGSHTVERLLGEGCHVVGLDDFNDYYDPARKHANVAEVRAAAGTAASRFELVTGDIRDRPLVVDLFERHGFDAVVHLAAMAGVRNSVENPWLYYDVNVTGTLNLLEATRSAAAGDDKPPIFVNAATSGVYGATKTIPFVEDERCDRPLAPYPASKRAAEMLGYTYHHLYRVDFTSLRFFTVYGNRGRPDMMAYKVLDSIRLGHEVPLYNGGRMHRDWTYVSDIVSGIVAATERRLGYEIVNLGRGEPVLLADFVERIQKLAGKPANLHAEPMPEADIESTHADTAKAERLLDYAPTVSVPEGVARFFEWYCEAVGRP